MKNTLIVFFSFSILTSFYQGHAQNINNQKPDSINPSVVYYDVDSLKIIASIIQVGEKKYFEFTIKNNKNYSIYFDTLTLGPEYMMIDENNFNEYIAVQIMPGGRWEPHRGKPQPLAEFKPGMNLFKRIELDSKLILNRFSLQFFYYTPIDTTAHPIYFHDHQITLANYDYDSDHKH